MADDLRTSERVRRVAAELANHHAGDRSTRAAFLERAIETVDRIAQTVDDRGLREALDADTDAAVLSALGLTQNGTPHTYMAATDPLAAAKARGEQAKRDILASQGDLIDASEVAARLGCDLAEVEARRRRGLLIALPDVHGKRGFPSWQFAGDSLLPGLEEVLGNIGVRSPWSQAAFFFSGDIRLDWQTPLEMLLRGEIEAVRRAAAAYGEQLPA
jgi:hypothetical protein